jgi:hypothetical protein
MANYDGVDPGELYDAPAPGEYASEPVPRMPRWLALLLAAVFALAIGWLLFGGRGDPCVFDPSRMVDPPGPECAMQRTADRQRAAQFRRAPGVAAYIVIVGALGAAAWLVSQPPPRDLRELLLRRRVWSGLALALALTGLVLWSQASQRGVIIN